MKKHVISKEEIKMFILYPIFALFPAIIASFLVPFESGIPFVVWVMTWIGILLFKHG